MSKQKPQGVQWHSRGFCGHNAGNASTPNHRILTHACSDDGMSSRACRILHSMKYFLAVSYSAGHLIQTVTSADKWLLPFTFDYKFQFHRSGWRMELMSKYLLFTIKIYSREG